MKLKAVDSLEYTKAVLVDLHKELDDELIKLEEKAGWKNWILRLMFFLLEL